MITRNLIIAGSLLASICGGAAENDPPPLLVSERLSPWGTIVERQTYYEKDGAKIEHGAQETFSADGSLQFKFLYAHGKEHGICEIFYEGTQIKQSEMTYLHGEPHGPFRTWAADGKLLFEGTWKNGKKQDGWFEHRNTSSNSIYHRKKETWEITQWKDGKKVPESRREVQTTWRSWTPGKLPDHKTFIRWNWPSYSTNSTYPHIDRMPTYQQVPFLIKCFEEKAEGYQQATDQLQALTRMQFGNPWLHTDPERIAAAAKWREWWETIGKHRPALQAQRGVKDPQAWNLAKKSRDLPIPEEPIVIPASYTMEIHFRSGDYNAVTSETLSITRHPEGASLTRKFSTQRDGPITEEHWLPFDEKEADRVTRAMAYLIDRPWLLNDEADIEKRYWAAENKDPESESTGKWCDEKLKGRECYGTPYYPSIHFELRDAEGQLWWNLDPDHWYGSNPERFNQTHQPVPGTIFPFLSALYPESTRAENTPGWVKK